MPVASRVHISQQPYTCSMRSRAPSVPRRSSFVSTTTTRTVSPSHTCTRDLSCLQVRCLGNPWQTRMYFCTSSVYMRIRRSSYLCYGRVSATPALRFRTHSLGVLVVDRNPNPLFFLERNLNPLFSQPRHDAGITFSSQAPSVQFTRLRFFTLSSSLMINPVLLILSSSVLVNNNILFRSRLFGSTHLLVRDVPHHFIIYYNTD